MKVVYVISLTHKSVGFELLFDRLKKQGLNFHVILINNEPSELFENLTHNQIPVTELYYKNNKSVPKLVFQIRKILKQEKPSHLHTHLLEAGFIGGFAGWITRIPNRIYTRHHSDTHFYENKHGKLYDRVIHSFYHSLICLSANHLEYLQSMENIRKRLVLIPNFVDQVIFEIDAEKNQMVKQKYGFNPTNFSIGISARWTKLKGVHLILLALLRIRENYPNLKIFMFNTKGDYRAEIETLVKKFPPDQIVCTEFEREIMTVYSNLDLFIHCPVRRFAESFGLVYVEALGSGTPSIITLSGIAEDIVVHGENAWVIDYDSVDAIEEALIHLIEQQELREKLSSNAKDVASLFSLDQHIQKLFNLYEFPQK